MRCYSQIEVFVNGKWVEPCGSDQNCRIDGRLSSYNKQAAANQHAVNYAKFHKVEARGIVKYRR